MRTIKKRDIALFLMFIFLASLLLYFFFFREKKEEILLIPLDSRPCNTQYVEKLSRMANLNLKVADRGLDSYLHKADKEELWSYLEEEGKKADSFIISINELFLGGLIASRNVDNYLDLEEDLERFQEFCRKNQKKEIIVINVLPRLLPCQFTALWDYREDLIPFGIRMDKEGFDISNKNIPTDILEDYKNIYKRARFLNDALLEMSFAGLIDELVIGQDDSSEFSPSNRIVRSLEKKIGTSEKIFFMPGADELTMLVLAKKVLPADFNYDLEVNYSNYLLKDYFFPFEAFSLEDSLLSKVRYLNLIIDPSSPNKLLIHTDKDYLASLVRDIQAFSKNYLGIVDVSYTNKGDKLLFQELIRNNLLTEIKGYSGWNTASNSLGTELSHFVFYRYMERFWQDFSQEEKISAFENYLAFQYIRLAEDFIYQGYLRDDLNQYLESIGADTSDLKKSRFLADDFLSKSFEDYKPLLDGFFLGEFSFGGNRLEVQALQSNISLPWSRTFEAKVYVDFKLHLLE